MLLTLDNPKVHFHYPRLIATLHLELRKQVFRKLKNEFSIFKSRKRDLTIGDVAHAQQNENKLSLPLLNRNIVARKQLRCKY